MKKIILSKEFIKQFKVQIKKTDDTIELAIDADFLIYLNHKDTFTASKFGVNEKGSFCDDTTVLKDLLCDQIIYADLIQKRVLNDGSEIDFITERFGKNEQVTS
ncbi:hypothetical protein [Polynucleobacter sp.]|uniref:hypothetical protein n=1 Tax=Polynucleobacter sp. TaxID=2029855 RepID=UPI003F6996E6